MSDWRRKVPYSTWRYTERRKENGDSVFDLEAKVWPAEWETFGTIDMDCAGEAWGEMEAEMIVNSHNEGLKQQEPANEPLTGTMED